MATLELNAEQSTMLKEILEEYLSELRMEVCDTEDKDFRDSLHEVENFINELLPRLA
jgi:hypothetical protein